jgi:hypothetical protein
MMKAKMTTRMAQGGKVAVLAMAMAWPVLAAQPLLAQQAGAAAAQGQGAMLRVTGEGRVVSAPDMAVISLGVTAEGDTAATALATNSTAIARVMENLRAAGVADRDIQTSGLSINPNWKNDDKGGSTISGYIASNMISVRVRALESLGTTLDAAVKDGANTLNGVEFALQDQAPAMAEARKRAVADALAKAELMAAAAGVKLGPISAIIEGGGEAPPMPMMRMAADSFAAGAVPVAAGEMAVEARVTVVWDLAR